MRKKGLAGLVLILIVAVGIILVLQRTGAFFDAGGRYDSTNLDFMGVIYANQSDIYAFNEAYSESDSCPWGFAHNGIDYFLNNDSPVIAAAPGLVEEISWRDYGSGEENQFHVKVHIRFNSTVTLSYGFEPWTQDSADKDRQLEMLNVEVGDWVSEGDTIGRFLYIHESAHIHFGTYMNGEARCPGLFFSCDDHNEIMSLIHSYQPGWELCYP